jgi:hypothetical protein
VGFEPTIPAFEREKTVHAIDRAATVIGVHILIDLKCVEELKYCPHISRNGNFCYSFTQW